MTRGIGLQTRLLMVTLFQKTLLLVSSLAESRCELACYSFNIACLSQTVHQWTRLLLFERPCRLRKTTKAELFLPLFSFVLRVNSLATRTGYNTASRCWYKELTNLSIDLFLSNNTRTFAILLALFQSSVQPCYGIRGSTLSSKNEPDANNESVNFKIWCYLVCLAIPNLSVNFGLGQQFPEGVLGTAGAPRFGMPPDDDDDDSSSDDKKKCKSS